MLGAARLTTKNLSPSFSVGVAPSQTNEGAAGGNLPIQISIYYNDISVGQVLWWEIVPVSGTINSNDFTQFQGYITLASGSSPYIINTGVLGDSLTEGTEIFTVRIRQGDFNGAILAVSNQVTINDTSTNATYAFTTPTQYTNPNEGTSTVFTVVTTNVGNGTVLPWTIKYRGTNQNYITAADFTSNSLTGTVTINNNIGTFTLTYTNDNTFEGSEAYYVELNGTNVISYDVNIQDTSDGGASLKIYPDVYSKGAFLKLALPFRQSTQFNDISYNFYSSTQNVAASRIGPSGISIATSGQKFYDGAYIGTGTQSSTKYFPSANINTRTNFCIMFWAKTTSSNWNNWVFGNDETGTGYQQYETGISLSTYNFSESPNNDAVALISNPFDTYLEAYKFNDGAAGRIGGLTANQWYHFCFTKTGWWVNGDFKGTIGWAGSTWNGIIVGGQQYQSGAFSGGIQDFRVYVGNNVVADYASFAPPAQMMPT